MATVKKGVWDLQQVRDQNLEGAWSYDSFGPGNLYGIGSNGRGELLVNDIIARSFPTQIPGTQWSDVTCGFTFTLATKSDGTLWVGGKNFYGQLGLNDTALYKYSSPVQVPGTQWNKLSSYGAGEENSFATKTDGTLWAWGTNGNGQLGQNDLTRHSSPIQIPGTQWNLINRGDYSVIATKTDGTLWVWGYGDNGQLGKNNITQYSSPVQVPGTQWNSINAGNNISMATKTDGTLWMWGNNQVGELGQNNLTKYSSPVQIPGTQWGEIVLGVTNTLATKTDGTLWAWGRGVAGETGQNDRVNRSSPIQVSGTQWRNVGSCAYYGNNFASKTDGTLWSWGYNSSGQLGQNDRTQYSSPTQIPGTQWNVDKISGGAFSVMFISSL